MMTLVICSRVSDFQVTSASFCLDIFFYIIILLIFLQTSSKLFLRLSNLKKNFVDIFKIVDWTKQRKQFSRDVVFVGTLIFNRSWTTTNHSTRNIVFTTFHNKDHFTCLHTTRDIQRETQFWLTILLFPFNPWKL